MDSGTKGFYRAVRFDTPYEFLEQYRVENFDGNQFHISKQYSGGDFDGDTIFDNAFPEIDQYHKALDEPLDSDDLFDYIYDLCENAVEKPARFCQMIKMFGEKLDNLGREDIIKILVELCVTEENIYNKYYDVYELLILKDAVEFCLSDSYNTTDGDIGLPDYKEYDVEYCYQTSNGIEIIKDHIIEYSCCCEENTTEEDVKIIGEDVKTNSLIFLEMIKTAIKIVMDK